MNKIKFNHEQIATTSALVFFVVLTLVISCTVWQLVMTICQYDNMSLTKTHSGIVVNVQLSIKQTNYFYNVNTSQVG